MPKRESAKSTQIDSVKHQDKRANIPTEELRDFMQEEDRTTKTILYPRDPSLDPQLVWKGKDEQDSKDLEVPSVPIYIQEKIHPHAIIEGFRNHVRQGSHEQQLNLFGDFSDLDFDREVDFYHHEVNWANRMILWDSLLVMNSLAEKEGLKGKVQCIYLDPPYGIKFGSNWQVSTHKREVKDGKTEEATRQPEQVKAFRDTWELGIHSYLAYLRDRLVVARELLTESGSIFVQIGDENVHLVRCLMDEVFGSDNFISLITFIKTSGQTDKLLASVSDYIIWYSKDKSKLKYRQIYSIRSLNDATQGAYNNLFFFKTGKKRKLTKEEKFNPELIPDDTQLYRTQILTSQSPGTKYNVFFEGKNYFPQTGYWKTESSKMPLLIKAGRIETTKNSLNYIRYADDFPAIPISNFWQDTGWSLGSDKYYVVQTGIQVM
jgi:adenine-specific DNA-methyltransferase